MKKPYDFVLCVISFLFFVTTIPVSVAANGPLNHFYENFDEVTTPDLPADWHKIVETTNFLANVRTVTTWTPFSEPNHVAFSNWDDANATLMLITPEVTQFDVNWLTFWVTMSTAAQDGYLIVGYMADPLDIETFNPTDTIYVSGNEHIKYHISFPEPEHDDVYHIGIRTLQGTAYRHFLLDDMTWEYAPQDPVISVTPESVDFSLTDVNSTSSRQITINNFGLGTLLIEEGGLSISGQDAEMFALPDNIEYPIELDLAEPFLIDLLFTPSSEGIRNAVLNIESNSVNSPFELPMEGTGLSILSDFFEDFSDAEPPNFNNIWSALVYSSTGSVETTTAYSPASPPNHVRMETGSDISSILVLTTPKVNSFGDNWLRFYAKMSSATHINDLVIGYLPDRNDFNGFTPIDTVEIFGNNYTQHTVLFNHELSDEDEYHIAFVFEPGIGHRLLFLDNILWDTAPVEIVIQISPEEKDFGLQHLNTTSEPVEFTITNDGLQSFTIGPDDFSIGGNNPDVFLFTDLPGETVIESGESITFSIVFAPQEEGEKSAIIHVLESEIPVFGTGADETIYSFPYFQDFSSSDAPNLPFGWKKIVDNPTHSGSYVQTTTHATPLSHPYHVRINSDNNMDADVMLISPMIDGLDEVRTKFWAKSNMNTSLPDLIIGTMDDPLDASTFTPFQTIEGTTLNNSYQEFIVTFDQTVIGDNHIAFKHGGSPSWTRSLFIDNISFEKPEGPETHVDPDVFTFKPTQINTNTLPVPFEISNKGIGTLEILPSEIFISGQDAGRFQLQDISETIYLNPFETETIFVVFNPLHEGNKEASLTVKDFETTLHGTGIDATISEVPHLEDFADVNTPVLPAGWTYIANNPGFDDASVVTTGTPAPFSPPYQVRVRSNNNTDAHVMFISPPLADTGSKSIRFQARCNLSTSVPDLIIGTMSDPADHTSFNPVTIIEGGQQLTNAFKEFIVYMPDEITGSKHIAWKHGGAPSQVRDILIDHIEFIEEQIYSVSFSVMDQDNEPIPNAVITLGEITNPAGVYTFGEVFEGVYSFSVTAPHFEDYHGTDLIVSEDTEVDVIMTEKLYFVSFEVFDQHDSPINDAVITFNGLQNEPGDYDFENIHAGHYEYSITAPHYEEILNKSIFIEENITIIENLQPVFYTVIFNIEDEEGEIIPNATISFGGINNPEGEYSFEMLAGVYDYAVSAPGYDIIHETDILVEENIFIDVVMSLTTHTVLFFVADQDGHEISDAVITFDGQANAPGEYLFADILPGTYAYLIQAEGYYDQQEQDLAVYSDLEVNVTMTLLPETYLVTFNLDMTGAEGFDQNQHQVFISGNFGGNHEWPVPGEEPSLTLTQVGQSMIFSISLDLEEGDYQYKYASDAFGSGWHGEEWPGMPFREIPVYNDTTTDDIWAVHPDEVETSDYHKNYITVYPNPANSHVFLNALEKITRVEIINLQAQIVYTDLPMSASHTVSLSGISPGTYLIRISTESQERSQIIQIR